MKNAGLERRKQDGGWKMQERKQSFGNKPTWKR